jgi:hypothetical protein
VAKVQELEAGSLSRLGHILPYLVVGRTDPNQTRLKEIIAAYYDSQRRQKKATTNSPMVIKLIE